MLVVEQLEEFLREHKDLAADPLAAVAMALAVHIDAPDTAASVSASCAATFQKVLAELRGMTEQKSKGSKLDELQKRRAAKLRKPAA